MLPVQEARVPPLVVELRPRKTRSAAKKKKKKTKATEKKNYRKKRAQCHRENNSPIRLKCTKQKGKEWDVKLQNLSEEVGHVLINAY